MLETIDTLTFTQVTTITEWFNKNIGTDYEINNSASGIVSEYYVLFFDLEGNEYDLLETYLKSQGIEWY